MGGDQYKTGLSFILTLVITVDTSTGHNYIVFKTSSEKWVKGWISLYVSSFVAISDVANPSSALETVRLWFARWFVYDAEQRLADQEFAPNQKRWVCRRCRGEEHTEVERVEHSGFCWSRCAGTARDGWLCLCGWGWTRSSSAFLSMA